MNSLTPIWSWRESHVAPMRQSRRKTLAAIVEAAMTMQGTGVPALAKIGAYCVGLLACTRDQPMAPLMKLPK